MVDYSLGDAGAIVTHVQLTDLETARYLPNDKFIKGMLAGNDNWRSPEAHCRGVLNKSTDIFSFGLVVSLANSPSEQ